MSFRKKLWIKKIFARKSLQPQWYFYVKLYTLSYYDFVAKSIGCNSLKSLKWNHLKQQKLGHCITKNVKME